MMSLASRLAAASRLRGGGAPYSSFFGSLPVHLQRVGHFPLLSFAAAAVAVSGGGSKRLGHGQKNKSAEREKHWNYLARALTMAAAGSLKLKVECLIDGKNSDFTHIAAPSDLVSSILLASVAKLGVNASEWNVCKDQGRKEVLAPSTTLESNGVKTNAKLWLGKIGGQSLVSAAVVDSHALPRLDPVDEELLGDHGKKVDLFTCAEKSSVFTVDQVPVDPWDPRVMKNNGEALPTMPFHAWLCQQLAGGAPALKKSTLRALDEPKFRESSKDKAARSITTQKDLAVRRYELKKQKYRHVDSVTFEPPHLLRPVIDLATGFYLQRVVWLYGNYEKLPYKPAIKESKSQAAAPASGFPLGIRTVVKAMFEPAQISSKVHIEFSRDAAALELTEQADAIAHAAGLQRVGWLFTDLERDASNPRRYLHKRHAGTYQLRSNEVVLAAELQRLHPNRCDFAASGYAGSKFSTVVLTGNSMEEDNIMATAYQLTHNLKVSDDTVHFLKQKIFEHSTRSNSLKVVQNDREVDLTFEWSEEKEASDHLAGSGAPKELVNSVKTNGFIPSDYFIIEIPATGNLVPQKPLFYDQNPTWICTRPDFDHENRVRLLAARVQKVREKGASPICELCDFNLLVFAASLGIVPIEEVKALTKELTRTDVDEILVRLLLQSPAWETLVASCL